MRTFWSFFWKLFGVVLLIMLCAGIVSGIISHSIEAVYAAVQRTLAIGLGICGIIGFVVVPIELYLEDRRQRRTPHAAE